METHISVENDPASLWVALFQVVFFIGNSTLNVDPTIYPANIGILNQIAAITSGHVIAYDDTETEGLSSVSLPHFPLI